LLALFGVKVSLETSRKGIILKERRKLASQEIQI
jgi:hypothetical protein